MILAVTGHRPPRVGGYVIPNAIYNAVMMAMDEALVVLRPDRVILGMALGVDQWMAELCIANDIPFFAAIPFDGFESRWPPSSQAHYRMLLSKASDIKVVTPGASYDHSLLQTRNIYMVRQCDKLLAVYDGKSSGGTANCIRAAVNLNKEVLTANISPEVWAAARHIEMGITQRGLDAQNNIKVGLEEIRAKRRHPPRGEVTGPAEAEFIRAIGELAQSNPAERQEVLGRVLREGQAQLETDQERRDRQARVARIRRERDEQNRREAEAARLEAQRQAEERARERDARDLAAAEERRQRAESNRILREERRLERQLEEALSLEKKLREENAPAVSERFTSKRVLDLGDD